MDDNLDQQSILIDATPDITLILKGGNTPDKIDFLPKFMEIPNYSSRDMAVHTAADLEKSLQTLRPETPFQVGDSQLKS